MSYFEQLLQRSRGQQLFDYHPNGLLQRCSCGQPIFFDNTHCVRCGAELGYLPVQGQLLALEPDTDHYRTQAAEPRRVRCCANRSSAAQCNWLIPADSDAALCLSCDLNLTIPDLSQANSEALWLQVEQAKRRLVAQLVLLGLPVVPRRLDPEHGLGFHLLRQLPGGPPITTGHMAGEITLDLAEADPANREQRRQQLHEPYRTLLGHFRHESGHYYWDRLVQNTDWLTPYRELFGDERADYQAALKTHYEQPVSDWQQHFISQYASAHPREDWAETWAHYLHMTDTLNAALDFGIQPGSLAMHVEPFDSSQLPPLPLGQDEREAFLDFCNRWVQLSSVLNVLARSMGQTDIYPFVLNVDSLRKLYLVHALIADSSTRSRAE